MASSIELVDRMDHAASEEDDMSQSRGGGGGRFGAKGRYAYANVGRKGKKGQKHDLFLKVETGGDDDDMSISSATSSGTNNDDYVGIELALERRQNRNRFQLCIVMLMFGLLIGSVVYLQRGAGNNNNAPSKTVPHNNADDDDKFPADITDDRLGDDGFADDGGTQEFVNDGIDEIDDLASLWPTAAPLPTFKICVPPIVPNLKTQTHLDVFHIGKITIVPEAPTKDDFEDEWEYTFSSLDINSEASIIAVGMSDFSESTTYEVGLVRVFAYDCDESKWKQLGQDLLGVNEYEQFGHKISSSRDGKIMAISAPQEYSTDDKAKGFVEVYFLNDNRWEVLGNRIENIKTDDEYYMMGHAIDLSQKGETLAVMAIVDADSYKYITRVFQYNYDKKIWVQKGRDLSLELTTADGYDFTPTLALSEDGDTLSLTQPSKGVVSYHFDFEFDKWSIAHNETKQASWEKDDYYVEYMDMDDKGTLIAFSAFEDQTEKDGDIDVVRASKIVDFSSDPSGTEVYFQDFKDYSVNLYSSVSDDGQVAAIVASRYNFDDDASGNYDYVGAMTIITKDNKSSDQKWRVVGDGTKAAGIGVPGSYVSLSGDGKIAAVGSDEHITLFGINLDATAKSSDTSETTTTETPAVAPVNDTSSSFEICKPFPNGTLNSHVGDLDQLPKQEDQHTLSLSMSKDGSIVAVGIDSYDGEDRGLVRVFAWDCSSNSYAQLGQDLFGADEFDSFGEDVDVSADGKTLAVGANQPPPGKTGYVEVYTLDDISYEWKLVGHRIDNVKNTVYDLGRQVLISDDGTIVAFSGSIVEDMYSDGYSSGTSFIRVVENIGGEWKSKGDDLIGTISYDEYGQGMVISQSGNGQLMAVTGDYNTFMAKVYSFDVDKKNWTETVIPPIKTTEDDDNIDDEYAYDYYYENYFSGSGIDVTDNGEYIAIAGDKVTDEDDYVAVAKVLMKDSKTGNWTLSHDPIDFTSSDWWPSDIGISADGQKLAVGINSNTDSESEQGTLFVALADDSDSGWNNLGKIDGRKERDLFGSRVAITRDGTLAAASSRKGYISFFKIGN